jgi:inner membrane protein involved in colicin E2 resistance
VGLFLKYETQPSLIGPVITIFFVVVFTDEETDRKINHNSRISHHWLINEEN